MSALDKQEGGNHYKQFEIQPVEYVVKNGIGYREGNVIKYVSRHNFKNGAEDIRKAIHYLEMILEDYLGPPVEPEQPKDYEVPIWQEPHRYERTPREAIQDDPSTRAKEEVPQKGSTQWRDIR